MKRLLLDTNIYGEMIFDAEYNLLKENIAKKVVVHGFKVVREELRDVPRSSRISGRNLRVALLHIYDEMVKKSYVDDSTIKDLAEKYYIQYKKNGGNHSRDKMTADFSVVACATIHQIDIVVSEDNKTMLIETAIKAYNLINKSLQKRTPNFIGYLEFKRLLLE
ncbi:hypothetical protein J4210_02230 [Candidatus Woesearchaeota archaeon]|nr:hypothetical protein [Candidatus Woesearchaeota archaeon]